MDIRMEGESWPVVGGLLVAGHIAVSMLRRRFSPSPTSTAEATRTQSPGRAGRSTWQEMRRSGSSPATAHTSAAAAPSSDRTMWVSDVVNARYAELGSRDHAMSLLDGAASAMAEVADQMQVCGDRDGSQNMIWVKDTCLDVIDLLAEDA